MRDVERKGPLRPGVRGAALLLLSAAAACDGAREAGPVAVGTLERDRVELIAEAQEPIVEIAVREGDRVAAGDLVLRLEDRLLASRVGEAEGVRDRARATLAELLRGTRIELVEEARAGVAEAESTFTEARRRHERIEPLVRDAVEPAALLDEAERAVGQAAGALAAARANLERLLAGATVEELDQARAALTESEAALASSRIAVERLAVVAPRAGVVDALPYEIGERPAPGATVATLLDAERIYARVYVGEPLRADVVTGTRARIRVDGREREFAGTVRWVSSDAAFTPHFALTEHDRSRLSYLAEIDLVEPEARDLPAGVPVEARFEIPTGPAATARGG
jgi:HlyD family secretion protein